MYRFDIYIKHQTNTYILHRGQPIEIGFGFAFVSFVNHPDSASPCACTQPARLDKGPSLQMVAFGVKKSEPN